MKQLISSALQGIITTANAGLTEVSQPIVLGNLEQICMSGIEEFIVSNSVSSSGGGDSKQTFSSAAQPQVQSSSVSAGSQSPGGRQVIMVDDSPAEAYDFQQKGFLVVEFRGGECFQQVYKQETIVDPKTGKKKDKIKEISSDKMVSREDVTGNPQVFIKVPRPGRNENIKTGIFGRKPALSTAIEGLINAKKAKGFQVQYFLDYDLTAQSISTDEEVLVTFQDYKKKHINRGYTLEGIKAEAIARLAHFREYQPIILTANTKFNVMLRHLFDAVLAGDDKAMMQASQLNLISLKGNALPLPAVVKQCLIDSLGYNKKDRKKFLQLSAGNPSLAFTSKTAVVVDRVCSNVLVGNTMWVSDIIELLPSLLQSCEASSLALQSTANGSSRNNGKVEASLIAVIQKVNSQVFPTFSASEGGMFSAGKSEQTDPGSQPKAKRPRV